MQEMSVFMQGHAKDLWAGSVVRKNTHRLLNAPELKTNDDRLPTSDDHKACISRKAIELPTVLAKVWCVTPQTPASACPDFMTGSDLFTTLLQPP